MFAVGDKVRIIWGAFYDFERTINEVHASDRKARVAILIYGRAETIELDFSELEPFLVH